MTIKFNNTDVTDCFVLEGIKFGSEPVYIESVNLDKTDISKLIGYRDKASFICMPLTTSARNDLLDILKSGWITVKEITNTGTIESTMKCTSLSDYAYLTADASGNELWGGISFEMKGKDVN